LWQARFSQESLREQRVTLICDPQKRFLPSQVRMD